LRTLEAEGLLRRNAALPVPEVPLRVGLVASPGTEGYQDFLGQLTGSGFGFHVQVVPVAVQGGDAPSAVARVIAALCRTDCDLVVVVSGVGDRRRTWPPSTPRWWPAPSPAPPSRSGRHRPHGG
jgi:exodeoxyribonuclease VII large subunit